MRSTTYPDQLGWGSERGHRVPIVIGWPMGSAGGQLWPPRRVQRPRVRQNWCGKGSLIAGYSGGAAAHGCPEWGPPVAASPGGVAGLSVL